MNIDQYGTGPCYEELPACHIPGVLRFGLVGGVPRIGTNFYLVESVENYALCMRRCLLCSGNMGVTHSALLRARIVLTPAPSIKLCAIASYRLFHSHALVVSFTDSMM